jgi:Holliday junction resolvasome RuvABC DNA-binding subunit
MTYSECAPATTSSELTKRTAGFAADYWKRRNWMLRAMSRERVDLVETLMRMGYKEHEAIRRTQ